MQAGNVRRTDGVEIGMGRIVFLAALVLASVSHAQEVEVKYAAIPATAMRRVCRVEINLTHGQRGSRSLDKTLRADRRRRRLRATNRRWIPFASK